MSNQAFLATVDVPSPLIWPSPIRQLSRLGLQAWARARLAPGYLYYVIERWGKHLARQPLPCRLFNGCEVVCDLNEHIQRQIYFFGAYEPIESLVFYRLLQPGMCVIDAGANIGQYTLIAAERIGPTGEVHAFEPIPENFQRLESHVRANRMIDRVRRNACALWNTEGPLELNLDAADEHDNASNYSVGQSSTVVRTVESRSVRLDDYARRNNIRRLDAIKMDIEGAELHALQGATELLASFRPTILMEINRASCQKLGYDPESIWDLLRPLGYTMRIVDADPAKCLTLDTLRTVERANLLFLTPRTPVELWTEWKLKDVIADFRSLRFASLHHT